MRRMKEFENKKGVGTIGGSGIWMFVHILIATSLAIHAVQRSHKPGRCISSRAQFFTFATQMHV